MCGIAGFIDTRRSTSAACLRATVERMTDTIRYRGPDAAGAWVDAASGVALGHRRLSILDLSAAGAQPMASRSERLVATYNGEIYNHADLRGELPAGPPLRGHSDTEVMLELMDSLGVVEATRRLNGMFAYAVWDARERVLHLARDRAGEKPLYYAWHGGVFLFASELKALRAFPGFSPGIDRIALSLFLHHGYVPGPRSIFEGVYKMPPGGCLRISPDRPGAAEVQRYWSLREEVDRTPRVAQDVRDSVDQVDRLLRDAVHIRMHADVPLGAFLSGGVDSSTIVAMMQAQASRPAKTFTIGFESKEYDEAGYARAVAQHLGTEHTELVVTGADALAVVPLLPRMYDEPFADSSQIPTSLVSKLARQHVTVSLSGDGGDELFGGYPRYAQAAGIWDRVGWMPAPVRRGIGTALGIAPRGALEAADRVTAGPLWRRLSVRNLGRKVKKLGALLAGDGFEEVYLQLMQQWTDSPALGAPPERAQWGVTMPENAALGTFETMMFLDTLCYLPDDILTKVDRASMAVSLESRAPLLDHRLLELAWRLPFDHKVRGGLPKWILKQVLDRYVPRSLIERPKMGFGVPVGAWLRGPLSAWARALLDRDSLRADGYLDDEVIRRKLDQHERGLANHEAELWTVLMFQAWLHG